MVLIESDATVNGGDRDLRFHQTQGDGLLFTKNNSTHFSLNTNGSLQFYGEDSDYLIKASSGSSLTASADDVWLINKITNISSNNGLLLFGNNRTTISINTQKDFVAFLDAKEVRDFSEREYNLIEGSTLNINSQNIFITQETSDEVINSKSTGINLEVADAEPSSLTAKENILIQNVNCGIYSSANLTIDTTNLLINVNSNKELNNLTRNNNGISTQADLNIVGADLIYITGAHKAIHLHGPGYVSDYSPEQDITANTIYLDAKNSKKTNALIEDGTDSTGILITEDSSTEISGKNNNLTFISKDFLNGIIVEDKSNLFLSASDIYIVNEIHTNSSYGISSDHAISNIKSNSLNISGYNVGIGLYHNEFKEPLQPNHQITLKKELNLKKVDVGFDIRNSDLLVHTAHASITTTNEGKAFSLSENAKLNFTSDQKSIIVGDITIDNSTFSLNTGAESTLEGKAVNVGENSTLDITMGKKSHWTVTDASNLSTLNASDSTIILNGIGDSAAPSLSMDALTGTGNTFVLAHDENLTSVSFISVKESDAETTHTVQLGDSAITADLGEVNVQFATDESGQTVFEAGSSITEAGLFISSPELDAQTNAAGGKDWFITNVENAPAPTPESIVSSLGNNYFFWRGLTESTRERFGQLRHGESAGVWGRITAGALSYGGIEANYQTYRLGADTSINPNWKVGVMLEQHEGKLDASEGRGDMDATTASLYALYTGNNGVYADGGLRFGIMDYEYVNRDMLVDAYDYDSSAVGGWLEVGHEWVVAGGWTVSPHVAFSYGRFSAKDFTTDNGLKVKADSVDSGIFTLGTDLGFKLDRLEVLFTADAMHEALGDQTITVSHEDSRIRQDVDYSDTWAEFGFNLSYRPTDQSLVWLNVRRSALADVEQDWKINLGARLLFN